MNTVASAQGQTPGVPISPSVNPLVTLPPTPATAATIVTPAYVTPPPAPSPASVPAVVPVPPSFVCKGQSNQRIPESIYSAVKSSLTCVPDGPGSCQTSGYQVDFNIYASIKAGACIQVKSPSSCDSVCHMCKLICRTC